MSDETAAAGTTSEAKRTKKLSKTYEGDLLVITESTTGTIVKYDLNAMPDNVKAWLMKHGFSQKLGDAAAGKEGKEALDAIQKVYEGLEKGDVTVRAPASEKVSVKSILEQYNDMADGPEKVIFKGLLEKIGALKK